MDHVRSVKFHCCKNVKDFPRWKKLLGRADPEFRVTAHTKVCSNHFKYGRPTADDPHPSLYLKGYPGISTPAKRKPTRRKLTYSCDSASRMSKCNSKKRNNSTSSAIASNTCQQDFNESTTHARNFVVFDQKSPSAAEHIVNEHNYAVNSNDISFSARCKPFEVCQRCINHHKKITDLEQELQKARELIKTLQAEIDSLQKKDFSIDDIKDDDHLTELYTGISTYGAFKFLSAKLEGKVAKMQYYKGTYSHKSKRYQVNESQAKPGRKRALNCDNELLMVLARLRQGLSVEDLAFRFKVSVSTVSTIISTWVPFLAKELESLIYWPRKEELQMFYPEAFKQFPHVSSIIDCTEIFLERPSMADTQALTYSTYKSHNTAKYLISLTPAGVVSFVSKGYGGLSSDRHIFEDCGVISKFEKNTACMVDRGFNVQDLLLVKQVKLYMPPFTKGQSQFTKQKVKRGQDIAKARIHVERAIERVKRFRIFNSVIPLTMKDVLDDIVLVCAALTNLMPPLIQNKG